MRLETYSYYRGHASRNHALSTVELTRSGLFAGAAGKPADPQGPAGGPTARRRGAALPASVIIAPARPPPVAHRPLLPWEPARRRRV